MIRKFMCYRFSNHNRSMPWKLPERAICSRVDHFHHPHPYPHQRRCREWLRLLARPWLTRLSHPSKELRRPGTVKEARTSRQRLAEINRSPARPSPIGRTHTACDARPGVKRAHSWSAPHGDAILAAFVCTVAPAPHHNLRERAARTRDCLTSPSVPTRKPSLIIIIIFGGANFTVPEWRAQERARSREAPQVRPW